MDRKKLITLADGAGGSSMQETISEIFFPFFKKLTTSLNQSISLADSDDAGVIDGIAITTDGHTVEPLFFAGGDIGRLAVCGTVNDLAAVGAKPVALTLSAIIEEGFLKSDLYKIAESIAIAAEEADTIIIAGDTKVVPHGKCDGLFLTTAGIGKPMDALEHNKKVMAQLGHDMFWLRDSNIREGYDIIITGDIGEHAIALLSAREGLSFGTDVKSDVAPLNHLMEAALSAGGVAAAKDPTRGGVAAALNEWAEKSGIGIEIFEEKLPIPAAVKSACRLFGLEPLELANEGKFLMATHAERTAVVLEAIKSSQYGRNASLIGRATSSLDGVVMRTAKGTRRIVDMPVGDPLPRIC